MISVHGTCCNSTNGAKSNLKGAGNGSFTGSNDVILRKRKNSGDVGLGAADGKECPEEFDTGGHIRGDQGKADDGDGRVTKDERGAVMYFVCPVRGRKGHKGSEHERRSEEKQSDSDGKAHVQEYKSTS